MPVVVDRRALEAAGIGTDTPMTIQLRGISLRAAIEVVLRDFDLTMIRDDGFWLITTRDESYNRPRIRVYPVRDLARVRSRLGGQLYDFQPLVDAILNVTGKPSPGWAQDGGIGTVETDPGSGSLVVSTVDPVHEEIESLLQALRQSRRTQGMPSTRVMPDPVHR